MCDIAVSSLLRPTFEHVSIPFQDQLSNSRGSIGKCESHLTPPTSSRSYARSASKSKVYISSRRAHFPSHFLHLPSQYTLGKGLYGKSMLGRLLKLLGSLSSLSFPLASDKLEHNKEVRREREGRRKKWRWMLLRAAHFLKSCPIFFPDLFFRSAPDLDTEYFRYPYHSLHLPPLSSNLYGLTFAPLFFSLAPL